MNKTVRLIVIYLLILSPAWFGLIAPRGRYVLPASEGNYTLSIIESLGIVAIGVIGVLISFLTRKQAKSNMLSIAGYALTAIIVCAFVVTKSLE